MTPAFTVEEMSDYRGRCDCCGEESRTAVGFIYQDGDAVSAYHVHWTVGHLHHPGANIDLILGQWGDEHGPEARTRVATLYRLLDGGVPALMVIDATGRPLDDGTRATPVLRRADVIGTPLAPQVFALTDAILLGDDRLF